MKIVFMGTPDFAVPTLQALCDSRHEVVAVFTQPDKEVGRKQVLTPPPVKVCATQNNIPVYQPASLKGEEQIRILSKFAPDVIVVVAYGKILPQTVLDIPKLACVNGHASLLPRHRGASPIQWSIVCGDAKTGITTMLMEKGLDTGDMLLKSEVLIGENETGEELHDRLSLISADLMLETLKGLEEGTLTPEKQNDELSSYAPIITREMGHIDFTRPALEVHNLIRGFYSWPAAYFILQNKRIKVLSARIGPKTSLSAGTIDTQDGNFLIACGDKGTISICELQPEGSKRMSAADYLKGHTIPKGYVVLKDEQ